MCRSLFESSETDDALRHKNLPPAHKSVDASAGSLSQQGKGSIWMDQPIEKSPRPLLQARVFAMSSQQNFVFLKVPFVPKLLFLDPNINLTGALGDVSELTILSEFFVGHWATCTKKSGHRVIPNRSGLYRLTGWDLATWKWGRTPNLSGGEGLRLVRR